jgi:hypothetical protein
MLLNYSGTDTARGIRFVRVKKNFKGDFMLPNKLGTEAGQW